MGLHSAYVEIIAERMARQLASCGRVLFEGTLLSFG